MVVAALEHGRHVVDVTYAHLDYRAIFIQAVGGDQRQRVLVVVAHKTHKTSLHRKWTRIKQQMVGMGDNFGFAVWAYAVE